LGGLGISFGRNVSASHVLHPLTFLYHVIPDRLENSKSSQQGFGALPCSRCGEKVRFKKLSGTPFPGADIILALLYTRPSTTHRSKSSSSSVLGKIETRSLIFV
jgi:hypothetical protein